MRNLKRNCQNVTFAELTQREEILDPFGRKTGKYRYGYSDKETALMCVSANRGSAEASGFGTLTDYDRVMTTANEDCPITEDSVLWIDADTSGPHNYVVLRRAKSLNIVSYAIKKVTVREGN